MTNREKKLPETQPILSLKEAIPIYTEMLSKNPEAFIFLPLAECYRRQGNSQEAIRICQEGLRKHPDYHSARVSLAMAYYDIFMIKQAKEEFLKVVKAHPGNLLAQRMLALIFFKEGHVKEALEHLENVLLINPYDEASRNLFEELKRKENREVKENYRCQEPSEVAIKERREAVRIILERWLQSIGQIKELRKKKRARYD